MHTNRTENGSRGFLSFGCFGLLSAVALVAGLLMPNAALAGELFEPVTAGELTLARQSAPTTATDPVRESFVRLNRAELAAHMAPLNRDRAPDRRRQALSLDGRVDMTLRLGVPVALKRNDVARVDGGGVLWTANVLGEDGGYGSFLIEREQILGQVQVGGKIFKIEPMTGALHRITEIDPRDIPGDIVVPAPQAPQDSVANLSTTNAIVRTRITYLVAYTTKAKKASPDIIQEIRFAIAWSNQAFRRSGANIKFELVGTKWVKNYDEDSTSYKGNLSDLTSGPAFAGVRRKRNRTNADLVSLIRKGGGGAVCGVAYLIEQPSAATAVWGYSVSSRGPCLPHIFPHEAGHNMGLKHDRYIEKLHDLNFKASKSKFNFGYVNLSASVRTIMADNNKCADRGKFCQRIQYFSTPYKRPNGVRIGKPKGKPGAAHNVRQLNFNRTAIADYR